MNISILVNGIVDFFHPGRGERYIRDAGFDTVALSLGGMIAGRAPAGSAAAKAKPFVAKTSIPVRLVKAPSCFFISEEQTYARPEDVMKAAEVAKEMSGVRYFMTDSTDDGLIAKLVVFFEGTGIKVLITNRTKYFSGRLLRDRFCEVHDVLEMIEKHGKDRLGFCFDTGEANLCGQDPAEMLYALKDVTDAVIVRENDGINAASYIPFTIGRTLDWGALFRGMRGIGFDGELIFEIGSSMASYPVPLGGEVVKRAYSMAEYFRWQIEMDRMVAKYPKRVLFGAGNMCRNYMRDYGKKYPPLFTVDNDSKVWGTVFEGLEVKSPEELKMLDEDTAIFICITYYREINEQLRGMGITNPIEYFNDEYPNTVYAGERLEREWSE
jgi:sugar phosphate isomerase/epimerase